MKQGSYLRVVRWDEFQHYKKRNPPWIKLYTHLLDDFEFGELPETTRLHLLMIWLLASKNGGLIPEHPGWVQRKIGSRDKPDLQLLMDKGFLARYHDASNMLSDCEQDAIPETEERQSRGETEVAPASTALADEEPSKSQLKAEVQAVFDHYCRVMGRDPNRYTLTDARQKKIMARLKKSVPGDLIAAINACRASPFHMGENERGALYNDLVDNILKSEEQMEKWINQPARGLFNGKA